MDLHSLLSNVFFNAFIISLVVTIVLAVTKKSNPYENKFNFNNNLKTLVIIFLGILTFHYVFKFFEGGNKVGGASLSQCRADAMSKSTVLTNAPDF
jgi:membrane protein CcdC involved in cytochrome C biogenesis